MSFEFLSTGNGSGPAARSPMEREALAAGARLEERDGWRIALSYDAEETERERVRATVGFADASHLGKIEVQAHAEDLVAVVGGEPLEFGTARHANGGWWLPYTSERAFCVCEPAATAATIERLEGAAASAGGVVSVIDMTSALGALTIVGPGARELFARFTAIDLRPAVTPVGGFRPGSVARGPGAILREDDERYLMVFGAALGRYMWTVVADAAAALGGGPVGADVLAPVGEASVHA